MDEYEEHFITTYTGKRFHYLDPKPDEIDIVDIAHALSLKCRFSGHCKVFYSVAEHSIRVAGILPKKEKVGGLMHDASEAYLPDIPRPYKLTFGLYEVEEVITKAIEAKFGITIHNPKIKEADDVLVTTEGRDLMSNRDGWEKLPEPLEEKIIPVSSSAAEVAFLFLFDKYSAKV